MGLILVRGAAACLLAATGMVAPATVAAGGFVCGGVPATIVGTGAADALKGTEGDDVIVALAGNDYVEDGGGDDLVCGNTGNDVMKLGAGDDLMWSGAGEDVIVIGAGTDVVRTGDGADWIHPSRQMQLGSAEIWTGPGDDYLPIDGFTPEALSVFAGGGDDEVWVSGDPGSALNLDGGVGQDILTLGLADTNGPAQVVIDLRSQTMRVNDGHGGGTFRQWEYPWLWQGNHHYTFHGTNGVDTVAVDAGSVEAYLHGGDDWIFGSAHGFVDGGPGQDNANLDEPLVCVFVESGACTLRD